MASYPCPHMPHAHRPPAKETTSTQTTSTHAHRPPAHIPAKQTTSTPTASCSRPDTTITGPAPWRGWPPPGRSEQGDTDLTGEPEQEHQPTSREKDLGHRLPQTGRQPKPGGTYEVTRGSLARTSFHKWRQVALAFATPAGEASCRGTHATHAADRRDHRHTDHLKAATNRVDQTQQPRQHILEGAGKAIRLT